MKKLFIYSFAAVLLIATSCRKSDNPLLPPLAQVPEPLITLAAGSSLTIPGINQDAFTAKFTVALYYPTGTPPAKFDIVVMKNGNTATVVTLMANVTTFPTTITVTGAQFRTLFNAVIAGGDDFQIGANITTQDGKTYLAFPPGGAGYSSGVAAQPGNSTSIDFAALAPFVATAYGAYGVATPYKVIQDGWADYTPGQIIPVTVIDATHLSFKYNANAAQPIIITVDPVTNITSVAKQVIGNYGAPYGNFSAVSVASPDDMVFPLKLTVGVNLHFTESLGSDFGSYTITLQKQ